ncbi:hypothetical protein E1B28_013717 [Marasmius oreades]|uniref:Protein kinase domain-containing protein n=1 Tax=Marasmius oreades TaxID=181124 RepID=A0A9P7RR52_9AGAR|nr:uncharacterized protein E1B28_013717 [Marasmius oreades]KAG7087775.1 hypothetical protein E1B28_013717 [Marasmius oreades]
MDEPHTLVILLFRMKLIKVHIPRWCFVKDLVEDVLYSGKYVIPAEVKTIMRPYKTRNLRYFTTKEPFLIRDLNEVPQKEELDDNLLFLWSRHAVTFDCADSRLPSDGSCLNVVVEEPLPIGELSGEGDERFGSREVVTYLNEHEIELEPCGYSARVAPGHMGQKINRVWCKLIGKGELETFETLEKLDPSTHHIASLLLPPHHLPATDQYLITMPDYGDDLNIIMKQRLSGTRIQTIARQLCEAIEFLHSHNLYHLDIKPQNLAIDDFTSDLTVIDLGWVMYGVPPCAVEGATGTYGFVAPEVRRWFDWEETEDSEGDAPPFYNPQKADAWAIGNVISILLDKDVPVAGRFMLESFSEWMMEERPSMTAALDKLDYFFPPSTPEAHSRSSSASLDSIDTSFLSSSVVEAF